MKDKKSTARRKLITAMTLGSGASLVLKKEWAKPVIQSVIIPAHAQTSCQSNDSLSGPISGEAQALLSDPSAGTIVLCASGLGVQSGDFENPGVIDELVIEYSFQGCVGRATLSGNVNGGTASGRFSYTLTCPSGECSGSGVWMGSNSGQINPLLYVGTWAGTQTCCGEPEFVIGRDQVAFSCPF